jgi:hypothetical protein
MEGARDGDQKEGEDVAHIYIGGVISCQVGHVERERERRKFEPAANKLS